jgi:hypothetical protein
MCSGFICRCHGMMKVYDEEIDDFLKWMSLRSSNGFQSLERVNFPMSIKVYKEDRITFTRFRNLGTKNKVFVLEIPRRGLCEACQEYMKMEVDLEVQDEGEMVCVNVSV